MVKPQRDVPPPKGYTRSACMRCGLTVLLGPGAVAGLCCDCELIDVVYKDMDVVMELRGDGFKLFADVIDPDPKNPNTKERDMVSVRHTLITRYSELVPHKTALTVKYRGVMYLVNRRRDYILITKEETK